MLPRLRLKAAFGGSEADCRRRRLRGEGTAAGESQIGRGITLRPCDPAHVS